MGYPDTPWQQGDILKSEELNAMVPGLSPLGTIIPWALPWNPTGAPDDYSNVDQFAPFHLPATGVVYPRTRAPELCAAIGHTFVDGDPDVGDVGDYVSGAALNKHHGSGYENTGIYRRTATGFDLVEADGFCTPDLRGRAPFGTGGTDVANDHQLGERGGDWRMQFHTHNVVYREGPPVRQITFFGNTTTDGNPAGEIGMGVNRDAAYDPNAANQPANSMIAREPKRLASGDKDVETNPLTSMPPFAGVNFLIACGVSGSATPSTRSGEVHRLHVITTDHMIRRRLADPNLSDEEREMLEAQLAGEPWPPPVDEPPATRTTTTTRKTATKTKTTRKRKS